MFCGCYTQSCPTLQPQDSSPTGSSDHRIFQARILEWAAISCCRGSSRPKDGIRVSRVSCISRRTLHHSPRSRGLCPHSLILPEANFFFPISHLLVCSFLALVSATLSVVSLFIFLLGLICCLSDSVLAHPQQSFKSMDKTYFACLHTCIHLDMPAAGLGFIISKPAALWPLTNSLGFFGLGKDITFNIHPFLEGRQKFIPIVLP